MSEKFKNFLKQKLEKEKVNPSEARKLGHLVDFDNLNNTTLRTGKVINKFSTPKNQNIQVGSKGNPRIKQSHSTFDQPKSQKVS